MAKLRRPQGKKSSTYASMSKMHGSPKMKAMRKGKR